MSSKKAKNSTSKYTLPAIVMAILLLAVGYYLYQKKSDDSEPINYKEVVYAFEVGFGEIDQLKEGLQERAQLEPVNTVSDYDKRVQKVLKDLENYLQDDSLTLFYEKHIDLETKFDWYRGTTINEDNRSEVEALLNDFLRLDGQIYRYLEEEYLTYRRKVEQE